MVHVYCHHCSRALAEIMKSLFSDLEILDECIVKGDVSNHINVGLYMYALSRKLPLYGIRQTQLWNISVDQEVTL